MFSGGKAKNEWKFPLVASLSRDLLWASRGSADDRRKKMSLRSSVRMEAILAVTLILVTAGKNTNPLKDLVS